MSVDDLIRARRQLATGTGHTTRENRILPFAPLSVQIPERTGHSIRTEDVAPLCLPGDLYQPPTGTFSAPAWYTDATKLASTDGLWKLDKSQWKRWSGRSYSSGDVYLSGSGPLVHFNFSSPASSAVLESTAATADQQFTEGPWNERTWHPVRSALYLYSGLTGILQRLKTIGFRATGNLFPSGGSLLTWAFSDDGTAVTGTTAKPACINRNGDEQGIVTRVLVNVSSTANHINKLFLSIGDKQLYIKTVTPYGWLPTLKESKANGYTGISPIYYANDLAKVNLLGQAYHGLGITAGYEITTDGLLNAGYPLQAPYGYQGPGNCNTRYTKIPGLAVPPDPYAPETAGQFPADFIAAGNRYYNDIVWFGGRHYACSTTVSRLSLTDLQWVHIDDSGVARVLSLAFSSRTASTTTWNVYNHGPVVFGQGIGSAVLLTTITITTTSAEAIAEYTGLNTTTKVAFQTGSADVQGYSTSYVSSSRKKHTNGYVLATTMPVQHSPTGRQIAVCRGLWWNGYSRGVSGYDRYPDTIHTVATFDIASDLTFSAPTEVFQWQAKYPSDRVTTFSYVPYPPFPDAQDYELATTTMTAYSQIECRQFDYRSDGTLNVVTFQMRWSAKAGTKFIAVKTKPHADRAPMVWPDEVESDINVEHQENVIGFGAAGDQEIVGALTNEGAYGHAWRLSNNCLWVDMYLGSSTYEQHLVSPMQSKTIPEVFGSYLEGATANDKRYASYNPRTQQFGGVHTAYVSTDPFARYCSWI